MYGRVPALLTGSALAIASCGIAWKPTWNVRYQYWKSTDLFRNGQWEEASQHLANLSEKLPDDMWVKILLSLSLYEQGKVEQANQVAQTVNMEVLSRSKLAELRKDYEKAQQRWRASIQEYKQASRPSGKFHKAILSGQVPHIPHIDMQYVAMLKDKSDQLLAKVNEISGQISAHAKAKPTCFVDSEGTLWLFRYVFMSQQTTTEKAKYAIQMYAARLIKDPLVR
jgi:hypothetical protein